MGDEIPRRICLDRLKPAETAIRQAMLEVEALGADTRLTDAVVLLQAAREAVADFIDDVNPNTRRGITYDGCSAEPVAEEF